MSTSEIKNYIKDLIMIEWSDLSQYLEDQTIYDRIEEIILDREKCDYITETFVFVLYEEIDFFEKIIAENYAKF